MENIKKIISQNLVELRKLHHYTQADVAKILKYSDKAVSKWESGESLPDIEVLYELTKHYGVSFEYLLKEGTYEDKKNLVMKKQVNQLIITCLSITLIWFMILVTYTLVQVFANQNCWVLFIYGVPLSCILALIFNSVWGNRRKNYAIISIITWSFLIAFFFTFLPFVNLWPIFLMGIPAQIAIILWSKLK